MKISTDRLADYFFENFEKRNEVGAALSIWCGEQEILSLAHGSTSKDTVRPWSEDTLVPVWSATKGPSALAVLMALDETGIDLDEPVEGIWPELKAARKGGLSFAQLLAHRSGLAALDLDNRPPIVEHDEVARALEKQDPFWQAGFGHGYHPRTYGAIIEEVVRRVTGGMPLGDFWRSRVGDPLGIDIFIGSFGREELERLARIHPPRSMDAPSEESEFYRALTISDSLSLWAFSSPSGLRRPGEINDHEFLKMGIPSLGGIASAKGLGKFYALLSNRGRWNGAQIVPERVVDRLSVPISNGPDFTLLLPTAFSAGLMMDPVDGETGVKLRRIFGPSLRAFGHPGAGGSLGFADPENGLSFAYVMNQMEAGILPNDKSTGLVDLLYS